MSFWLEYYRDKIKLDYNSGYGSGCGVGLKLRSAGTQLQQGNPVNAGEMLYEAGTRMYDFAEECLTRWSHQRYYVIDWLDECNEIIDGMGEAPALTMRAILDEMFTASNEELMQFVALVDAYRQSLWNKPFDANYWAAVARGFEQWEF